MRKKSLKFLYRIFCCLLAFILFSVNAEITVFAKSELTNEEKREERKTLPIQTNSIENWPQGPAIGAQSAILMEINTRTILYAKNIHEKSYPASTTKILTSLLAMQNCTMDEIVTFSHNAIYDVPTDGSKLGGVDTGDTITMEQALYCILVQSANEVASAVGEHVAKKLGLPAPDQKPIDAFTDLMNQKARELGCRNTNFVNANGLYDDNHYTTAYDLALIGCEFFSNELLCKMSSAPSYHFKLKPEDEEDTWISSKNQLYKGKPYEYSYLLGSKTGFVSQSRQTLVSAAEKNGMKLVCVIFTEETPYQFEDTIALFQYGFENFQRLSVTDNEKKYNVMTNDLFDTGNDLFGDSTPLMSLENDSYVILPNTAAFTDMVSTLDYADSSNEDGVMATIHYTYSDIPVGSCKIVFSKSGKKGFSFLHNSPVSGISKAAAETKTAEQSTNSRLDDGTSVIFINVQTVIFGFLFFAAAALLVLFVISVINSYSFSARGQSNKRRRKRRQERRFERHRTRLQMMRQKRIQRKRRKEYKKR